jgi:glycosyltransferase involved in cell wall biosynthesis
VEKGKMKIALFSPYIPKHIGGGEKYFFDVAKVLIEEGHQVTVAVADLEPLDSQAIQKKYEQFLSYSLNGIHFVKTPLGTAQSFFKKLWWTKQFDVLYYVTDGSLFFSLAARNILHIQTPLILDKSGITEQLKLKNWQVKNTNSEFTKKIIEKHWHTKIDEVHYPMIELDVKTPKTLLQHKEKIILHVGRFFSHQHSKRQDVLALIFKNLIQKYPKEMQGWKLVLVGTVEDPEYAKEVAAAAEGAPIEIDHQLPRQKLLELYEKASIYWHATGFGVNEEKEPQKTEHFGISTVEAMANGCVPIVIGLGGQPEAVGKDFKDLLWQTEAECQEKTLKIIQDKKQREELAQEAMLQSQQFNKAHFKKVLLKMVGNV